MRLKFFAGGLMALAGLFAGQQAMASPVVPNPAPGGEVDLIPLHTGDLNIMDTIYGSGNWVQIDPTQSTTWTANDHNATVEARYAGDSGALGSSLNPVTASNYYATTSGLNDGFYNLTNGTVPLPTVLQGPFTWQYENLVTGTVFSSDPSQDPDTTPHMIAFYITGGANKGSYVLAWEDLTLNQGSDFDYNDAVFQVDYVSPNLPGSSIPEPATVIVWSLLGGLGISVGWLRRRRAA